jgi:hypothetical protein
MLYHQKTCKYAVSPEKGPVHTHFLSLSSTLYLYKIMSRTPKQLTNSTEQPLSWDANNLLVSQKFPAFMAPENILTAIYTRAYHWSITCAK